MCSTSVYFVELSGGIEYSKGILIEKPWCASLQTRGITNTNFNNIKCASQQTSITKYTKHYKNNWCLWVILLHLFS